jgi:hypothetical protein
MCLLESRALDDLHTHTHSQPVCDYCQRRVSSVWAWHVPRKFDPYSQEGERVLPTLLHPGRTTSYHEYLPNLTCRGRAWCVPRWDVWTCSETVQMVDSCDVRLVQTRVRI